MTEGKVAVIGEKQIVTAFKAIGFDTFFADTSLVTLDILRKLVKENSYAVIFITEDLASQIDDALETLKNRSYPIVVPLPSLGSGGYGISRIKSDVEKAIGVDILFNKN